MLADHEYPIGPQRLEWALLGVAGMDWQATAPGRLEAVARQRFGLSPTQFWQQVNTLIGSEAAQAHAPAVVRALRARRDRNRL